MKKSTVKLLIVVGVLLFVALWCNGTYNSLVTKDESVSTAWSQVENVYQRRADLIPNLVNVVKGYAQHEKSTLEAVITARAKATSVSVDPSNLTPEKLQQFQQNQGELSTALGKLMVIKENYPELKADKNFAELQAQLEGTENRIAVERKKYNDTAREYNTLRRHFPTSVISSMTGFEAKPYFKADEGTSKAPTVQF